MAIDKNDLLRWCSIPAEDLQNHPERRVPFRLCENSEEMGRLMADDFLAEIVAAAAKGVSLAAIVPCGPSAWYAPFVNRVNAESISLHHLTVFHMDECLDWQGEELPRRHPYSFRGEMERRFYDPVRSELEIPVENRRWLTSRNIAERRRELSEATIEITLGGWGQDGHIAYNQSDRREFVRISLGELRQSTIRLQNNNPDTILALAQRTLGTAYQLIPPMSVTLGLRECLSGRKVRLYSDTGAWKQTALRVALFSEPDPEYPITLLQEHPDALLTATRETAAHPVSLHPEWDFGV